MSPGRRAVAAAGVVVLGALGAGCSRPHLPTLSNGGVSTCYQAIPSASAAVHDTKARLVGVHRLSVDAVTAHLPAADRGLINRSAAGATIDNDATVCAVAWKGTFAAGQVASARQGSAGAYAIVLVTGHKHQVLATLLVNQIPHRLKGRFA